MSDKIEIPAADAREWVDAWAGHTTTMGARTLRLYHAIKAALWQPPVVTVPWIDVNEHPHPTDGTPFLYANRTGVARCTGVHGEWDAVTHWCPLPQPPETAPKSPWRSVDDPPKDKTATVWVCGGTAVANVAVFKTHWGDRTHWAPYVEGDPMPPLPEGVER